jgi:hypothetical protein
MAGINLFWLDVIKWKLIAADIVLIMDFADNFYYLLVYLQKLSS